MTHNNQEERSVEELDEIQRLIVEKDPDDNDKFLRQLWDLVAQAKETFHHQLQKAREESIKALEIADGDIPPFPSAKDIESAKIGFITGVAWARTRLHSDLDQDNK